MQNTPQTLVVLGTGGTIAGTAADPADSLGYTAAQLGVAQLVQAVPALGAWPIEAEQVAQIDSKDMGYTVWRTLARGIAHHLARSEVQGIVVTHGTDTLEETAYFLQRVLAPNKPVVLTAAMRPATSAQADGPQNLLDAVRVAADPASNGVLVVMQGQVHSGLVLRKDHTQHLEAFHSGDEGPLGTVVDGQVRYTRPPRRAEAGDAVGLQWLPLEEEGWPRVEIVTSHVGADGLVVRLLCEAGVQALVVAGTGNGTVHEALEAALLQAQEEGITVWRSSRCGHGPVSDRESDSLPSAGELTPVQARVELLLQLLSPG